MIKTCRITLSVIMAVMLLILSTVCVLAENQMDTESVIFFEPPQAWVDCENIYCHVYLYLGERLVDWEAPEALCTKISDGLYSYDLSKVSEIESDKYYILIFSNGEIGECDSTFDVLLSDKCLGDTVYCDDSIHEAGNNSSYYLGYWKESIPELYGDINLDKRTNIKDVTTIQKYLAKLEIRVEYFETMLDVNSDGRITISDATYLQKYLAKIEM